MIFPASQTGYAGGGSGGGESALHGGCVLRLLCCQDAAGRRLSVRCKSQVGVAIWAGLSPPAPIITSLKFHSSAVGFVLLQKPFTSGKRLSRTTVNSLFPPSFYVNPFLPHLSVGACGPLLSPCLADQPPVVCGSVSLWASQDHPPLRT